MLLLMLCRHGTRLCLSPYQLAVWAGDKRCLPCSLTVQSVLSRQNAIQAWFLSLRPCYSCMQISDWMYAAPSAGPQPRIAHSRCTAYHTTCRDCAAAQAEVAFVEVCFTGTASINKTTQRCTDWLCFWFCLSGSCDRLTVAVDRFIQPDMHSDRVVVKFCRHDHYILFVVTFSVTTFLVLLFGILCCANHMDACMRAVSSFQGC